MKILSMTATFGKLEQETLTLKPGLNVIEAPNEWGKSTWCAFLLAMLYGVDTRQRSKAGVLADKDHYKPWSGKPMEGSLRILWKGRDITIQRQSRGRVPMGEFRAYETESGLAVKELTADNCGQVLLGVERTVYSRSGFIAGRSLEVTDDPELRRRLQLLVTTGQDSPELLRLETRLKELSKACQSRTGGALPQTRQALEQCIQNQQTMESLARQAMELQKAMGENQTRQKELSAHLAALDARREQEKREQVEQARLVEAQALELEKLCREQCQGLPEPGMVEHCLLELERLEKEANTLELEDAMTPRETPPEIPQAFRNQTTEEAMEQARQEEKNLRLMEDQAKPSRGRFLWIPALVLLLAAVGMGILPSLRLFGIIAAGVALVPAAIWLISVSKQKKARNALSQYRQELSLRYGEQSPLEAAETYRSRCQGYETRKARRETLFAQRRQALEQRRQTIGYDKKQLLEARTAHEALANAHRDRVRATHHREQLEAVAGELPTTAGTTTSLTLTRQETVVELERLRAGYQSLHSRLEVCASKARALPGIQTLEAERQTLEARLRELERWQKAISLCQEQLQQAKTQLSRRFAPRISREAGEILSALTEGRYSRLLLEEDFTLHCQQQDEVTRQVLWHSTGTEDQMYLALRLAVAQVLMPEAPLVLDDALIRFDRQREKAALDYLGSLNRQVVVFRCK